MAIFRVPANSWAESPESKASIANAIEAFPFLARKVDVTVFRRIESRRTPVVRVPTPKPVLLKVPKPLLCGKCRMRFSYQS